MRIRTFTAATMSEAMADVRAVLGDDAIIISSNENPRGRGVEVRAAVEESVEPAPERLARHDVNVPESDLSARLRDTIFGEMRQEIASRQEHRPVAPAASPPPPKEPKSDEGWVRTGIAGVIQGQADARRRTRRDQEAAAPLPPSPSPGTSSFQEKPAGTRPTIEPSPLAPPSALDVLNRPGDRPADDRIESALAYHRVPDEIARDLLYQAANIQTGSESVRLGAALDQRFRVELLPPCPPKPIMLVGPPGVGKTVTAAKLAAQAVLKGRGVAVFTTDTLRAGAMEQLASFTDILGQDLLAADNPEDLAGQLAGLPQGTAAFIDTPATNPFVASEIKDLETFLCETGAEPVLCLSAGADAADAAEIARIFSHMGVKRMISTRIDSARRIGSMLAAADAGRFAFAQISITPYVAQGLSSLNPLSLARLLLQYPFPHGPASKAEAGVEPPLSGVRTAEVRR